MGPARRIAARRAVARPVIVARPVAARPVAVAPAVRRRPVATTAVVATAAATRNNTSTSTNTTSTYYYGGTGYGYRTRGYRRRAAPRRAKELAKADVITNRIIYDLAKESKWEELKTKLDLMPIGAKYVDVDEGQVALHVVCSKLGDDVLDKSNDKSDDKLKKKLPPDITVVKKLLEYYPDTAMLQNMNGDLPIHLCVSCSSLNKNKLVIIQTLLNAAPEAVQVANDAEKTPLGIVYLNFMKPDVSQNQALLSKVCTVEEMLKEEKVKVRDLFVAGSALILASDGISPVALKINIDDENKSIEFDYLLQNLSSALHNYSNITTPPGFLELSSRLFSNEVALEQQRVRHAKEEKAKEDELLGIAPSTNISKVKSEDMVLHKTISAGITWEWGLQSVAQSLLITTEGTQEFKELVGKSRLYPFLSAAVGVKTDLDTVWQLLRAYPDVVRDFIPKKYVLKGEREKKKKSAGFCKCVIM